MNRSTIAKEIGAAGITSDVARYLDRIGYHGSVVPNQQSLCELHLAHLMTVPFENLSIHRNEPIVLNTEQLFKKIVLGRRGGFCYELNGLFAWLLRALGFEVEMLAAEVAGGDGAYGPKFDHMALRVTLDEPWLVDVGFGELFLEPLLLDVREPQLQGATAFRIQTDGKSYFLERKVKGDWTAQYRFGSEPHEFAEYEPMCLYHQTSPDSHFTRNQICSRATPNGRITLSGMNLISTTLEGIRHEKALSNAEEYAVVLRDSFGIVMDD